VISRAVLFGIFGLKSDKHAIFCYCKTKRHAAIGDKPFTLRTDWLNLRPFVFLRPTSFDLLTGCSHLFPFKWLLVFDNFLGLY
jgi:hypothetical protein